MRTVCITLGGAREERARKHLADLGINARFFYGLDAAALGLQTLNPYEVDGGPGCGFNMGFKPTGTWISHRATWAACLLLGPEFRGRTNDADRDEFLILEDDVRIEPAWQERFEAALAAAPRDWNVIFFGSCCTDGKPKEHIAGEVFRVEWPMCLHMYLVRRRALREMIATQDAATCYGPIDITLLFHTFPKMGGVYTVLPRLADQFDITLGV
jgi:GR25 family glycosyltransferase involved in LPS biosynthesis